MFGCFSYANNSIEGYYSLLDKETCTTPLNIEIKQDRFTIYSDENQQKVLDKGEVEVIKDDDSIYLKMNTVEGKYENNSILIQNSGNAMNEYIHFDFCDKYLKFLKTK